MTTPVGQRRWKIGEASVHGPCTHCTPRGGRSRGGFRSTICSWAGLRERSPISQDLPYLWIPAAIACGRQLLRLLRAGCHVGLVLACSNRVCRPLLVYRSSRSASRNRNGSGFARLSRLVLRHFS